MSVHEHHQNSLCPICGVISTRDEPSDAEAKRAECARIQREHAVMAEVLASLDLATRCPLGHDLFHVGFVWAQNQEALLAGETTWAAQLGPASFDLEAT